MSVVDDDVYDILVILDFIGNFVWLDFFIFFYSINVIFGEIGDKLFFELLNILFYIIESLCGKVIGFVLLKFLEYSRIEWCKVSCNCYGVFENEGYFAEN